MEDTERKLKLDYLKQGFIDGIPIGLVYFVVSFSLGIAARNVNMTAVQGFFMSFFTIASAGEYAGISIMAACGTMLEMVLITIVTDIRYILMSCALSQRFDPKMPFIHKIGVGALITDEIFAIQIAREGYIKPSYAYGAGLIAVPLWAIGTSLGIIAGNILPLRLVSAFSVALYGMFIGIIIPVAKNNKAVMISVIASFAFSYLAELLLTSIPAGFRMIILIVIISVAIALLFPVKEAQNE